MNRFKIGGSGLYSNNIKDEIPDNTIELFKKENKEENKEEKITNSFILSNDLSKVLKKNRELYNYIEMLESDLELHKQQIKKLEKKINT